VKNIFSCRVIKNQYLTMPCRICKQTGHNARTHKKIVQRALSYKKLENTISKDINVIPNLKKAVEEKLDCPICMEPVGDKNKFVTACGHTFCGTCILTNFQRNTSCPLCRGEIAPNVEFETARSKFKRLFAPRELMDIIHERLGKTLNNVERMLVVVAEKESTGENHASLSMSLAQPILRGLLQYTQELSDHIQEKI